MIGWYAGMAVLVSFVFTLIALPYWIRRSKEHGLLISDAQKFRARVPYLAGLVVVLGAVLGILFFVAEQTFLNVDLKTGSVQILLATVASILLALTIGVVDDLLGEKIGLRKYQKLLLTFCAAVPMVVVNAGQHAVHIPFFGPVELGHLYALLVIPAGIVGASNGFNILAGVNGLEAGLGIIILFSLGVLAWLTESVPASVIAFCMVAALIAFFWFNKFPAKILPGNSLTYAVGACIAVVAIVGNLERSALILFVPYFIELLLKLRGLFQKESLARPLSDGSLANKYDKWYSLNHVVISLLRNVKGKAREWEVALVLLVFELIFVVVAFALAKF